MLFHWVQDWIESIAVVFVRFSNYFLLEIFSFCIFVCFSPIFEAADVTSRLRDWLWNFAFKKKKKPPIFLMSIVKFCICFVFKYGFLISRTFCVKIWRPTIECEFVWRWGWYCGRRRARIWRGRICTPYGSVYSSKVLSGDGGWKLEKRKKSADCK